MRGVTAHAGARRPTRARGGVNCAYRYRPSGRRDGSLYAGTDLMVTLRLLRPAKSLGLAGRAWRAITSNERG